MEFQEKKSELEFIGFIVKKQITAGIVTEILEPSVDRVVAPCVYFGTCSGCQLQHVRYDKQLEFKRQRILGFLDDYDLIKNTQVLPLFLHLTYGIIEIMQDLQCVFKVK